MLAQIVEALRARRDLLGWSVRRLSARELQLYALADAVESRRSVASERYVVELLCQTRGPEGAACVGNGQVTLLPGDDIDTALDAAALIAGLVRNRPYALPGPAALPELQLADPQIQADASAALDGMLARLRAALSAQPQIQLTAAEFFVEELSTQICNSRGIDASQHATSIALEWVVLCRDGARAAESLVELRRRRVADIDIEAIVATHARHAADLLVAAPPPAHSGAVLMRGETLATFLNGGVLQTLASAATKFSQLSRWEIGQPVFRGAATGDPLTVYANRRLPFGTNASRFDDEGQPAQRVELIRNNRLLAFTASQRYADYLATAPTGDFGDIELPAGNTPAAMLLQEPYVEIVSFSWFTPDEITGDFSSEIRLGYIVEGGRRQPFKGGALVGNLLDALANVRWSSETDFYGDYQGPAMARFGSLTVTG